MLGVVFIFFIAGALFLENLLDKRQTKEEEEYNRYLKDEFR